LVQIDDPSTIMGVNHQHWLSSSQQSTPTVISHLRLRNRSLQTMSTLFRTLSVVLLISISYKPSLVLCASAAKNEFAGATHDYLGVSSTTLAAGTEDTPISYHELKIKDPEYRVRCSPNEMLVEIVDTESTTNFYLQHLKNYPDKACKPRRENGKITFRLNLANIYECSITKVVDRESGRKVYYHHIVIEHALSNKFKKQAILVKCDSELLHGTNSSSFDSKLNEVSIVKRSAQNFPANFQEPDYEIEITSEVTGRAPTPELTIGVKQSGYVIDDELTVKPGTPLNMEISLDQKSKDIYGLLVSNMRVTDTRDQEENLIINGCTIDPYLFENFLTDDGNLIRAKFKAFKFPESNFVRFEGVVNVCLDTCPGVECSNGQIGFGRKKRNVPSEDVEAQRIYEVSMSTIVKVAEEEDDFGENPLEVSWKNRGKSFKSPSRRYDTAENLRTIPKSNPIRPIQKTQRREVFVERAVIGNVYHHPDDRAITRLSEEFGSYKYIDFEGASSTSSLRNKEWVQMLTMILAIAWLRRALLV